MVQKARNLYKVPPYTKIHTLQTNYIQDNYNKITNYHKKVQYNSYCHELLALAGLGPQMYVAMVLIIYVPVLE